HGDAGLYQGIRDGQNHHAGLEATYVEGDAPAPLSVTRWYINRDVPTWDSDNPPPLAERTDPASTLEAHTWPTQGHARTSPYPVILRVFEGGWYEAARIHREWALKQRWCRKGRLADRQQLPIAADLDLWFCRYGFPPWDMTPSDESAMVESMHLLRDSFDPP